jgi:hypothetical protein
MMTTVEHNQEKVGREIKMKHTKFLLSIIEEEINKFLQEQAAPAAPTPAPTAPTPPADPSAAEDNEPDKEEDGDNEAAEPIEASDKLEQTLKSLASKTPIDIKKTLLASLQNGAEKEDTETLVAYVDDKDTEENIPQDAEATEEKEVPQNIKKAVKHIIKTFNFSIPEKAKKKAEESKTEKEEKPAEAPAPSAPPVKESRLQTSLREYLVYKQLNKKVRR